MAIEDVGLRAKIEGVNRYMADSKKINDETARIGKQSQETAQRMNMSFSGIVKAAAPVAAAIAAVFAVRHIVGGIGSMISVAGEFETSMNRVAAVSGAAGQAFDDLREQAKELGRTTQFTASQSADAMGFLAMAGFEATQIMAAMPSTLQLAAAAQIDLGRAADITSNILTGYGLTVDELGRANDVLVKAMTSANVDLSMLGQSFKYVGPIARSAGVEFEEAAAAIGLMGNAGIQGSMAGTSLRMAITAMLKPGKQAADVMKRLGVSATDSNGQLRPMVEIIRQLEMSGANTADMMTIFGQRSGPAMAALVDQGADAIANLTAELRDSGGTAERIANVQMQGLEGALKRLASAWEGIQIEFGESILPAITPVVDAFATALPKALEAARPALQRAAEAIQEIVTNALIAGTVAYEMVADWQAGGERLRRAVDLTWEYIRTSTKIALIGISDENLRILRAMENAWFDFRDIVSYVMHQISQPSDPTRGRPSDLGPLYAMAEDAKAADKALRETLEKTPFGVFQRASDNLAQFLKDRGAYWVGLHGQVLENTVSEIERQQAEAAERTGAVPWERPSRESFLPGAGDDIDILQRQQAEIRENIAETLNFRDISERTYKRTADLVKATSDAMKALRTSSEEAGKAIAQGGQTGEQYLAQMKEEAQLLTQALREAEAAMRGFAAPRLEGMGAAEDELFDLEQAIKRARLEELGLGEAGKQAAKEIRDSARDMGMGFDELAAQQRELAEGIPVTFQRAMWEMERDARRVDLDITPPSIAPSVSEEMSERQRLERLREAKQLMRDLTYEPQLRALQKTFAQLTGADKEITFEEAVAGMYAMHTNAEMITTQLGLHEDAIRQQEAALREQNTSTANIQTTRAATVKIENQLTEQYRAQRDVIEEEVALLMKARDLSSQPAKVAGGGGGTGRFTAMAEGGDVTRGGIAMVGERGPELAYLPTGTRVIPNHALQSTNVSQSYHDEYNIHGVSQPMDVWQVIQTRQRLARMAQGRR